MKSVDQKIIERFSNLLGNEKVRINEPMNRHTTFRIGGPADYFLLPSSSEESVKRNHFSILSLETEATCW